MSEKKESKKFFSLKKIKKKKTVAIDTIETKITNDQQPSSKITKKIMFGGNYIKKKNHNNNIVSNGDTQNPFFNGDMVKVTMVKSFNDSLINNDVNEVKIPNNKIAINDYETIMLILSNNYIKDSSQRWHMEHFNCVYCNKSLTTARYALSEDGPNDGKPICIPCYEQQHSNVCEECQKPIGVNNKDLSFNELHWHDKCFVCSQCKSDLYDKPFGSKSDRIFCANCYDNNFALRCSKCDQVFEPGQRKLDYRGKLWHDTCFCCKKCLIPIGNKTFLPKEEDVFCSECYRNVFATRCIKCCEIITDDGIKFRDEPWHAHCFKCIECEKELFNIPFTSRENKPYCRECHANLFAPKCDKCLKPIIGSTCRKMITHGNRHWHLACFKCQDCQTDLGGKGFIALNGPNDIHCSACAKEKLAKQTMLLEQEKAEI